MSDPAATYVRGGRRAVTFGLCLVAVLVLGFGGWAAIARIDGAVVAGGQVEVDQNRQVVAHPDGGEVAAVHVREGDTVAAGDPLVTLSGDRLSADLTILSDQYHEMLVRAARLAAERDGADAITFPDAILARTDDRQVATMVAGQTSLFEARRTTAATEIEQLARQRRQIEAQITALQAQRAALVEQAALVEEELTAQASLLERGLTQQSRVIALRRDLVGVTGEIGRLDAVQAQAEVRITEIELQSLKTTSDRREAAIAELRDVEATVLRLRAQRDALQRQLDRLDIRAPVAGVIYGMQVNGTGAVIAPAQPVLYLVPQDRPLVITARISPVHVDQVYPGQPVRLRFTTFDRRTTPELEGTVNGVSADVFTDEATGAPYYRTEINIPEAQRARLPAGSILIPGMPVETYMSTGERTALAYLTKPLTDYFNRAFRED